MPHSLKREKELLDAVMKQPLSLAQAVKYFAGSATAPDVESVGTGIRSLQIESLIRIRHVPSGEMVPYSEELLAGAAEYEVSFASYGQFEHDAAKVHQCWLEVDIEKLDPNHYRAGVVKNNLLSVYGELEGAGMLVEQARSFTHRFALDVLRRDFEAAWRLFASRLRTEEQPEVLKRKIENRERTAGHFEHFDHVEVRAIYHGPNSRWVPSSLGLWPKGMDKKLRRAETLFELGSFISPSGAFMVGHRMLLSLIEEEGVLRVVCYEMASG